MASSSPQHYASTLLDDLELRPPLPPSLDQDSGVSSTTAHHRSSILRPLLCRMFCASHVLKLSNEARFSSLVLVHRYFVATIHHLLLLQSQSASSEKEKKNANHDDNVSSSSINSIDWKMVGAACLLLGTKAEEESRRLRDIVNVCDMFEFGQCRRESKEASLELIHAKEKPMLLNENYWSTKEQLIAMEQRVLRMLQFDVCVSHPHRAVAVLLSSNDYYQSPQHKQELLPLAWRYLNQALFYAPALRHDVLTLACSAIECAQTHLEKKKNGATTNCNKQHNQWWLPYQVSTENLQCCVSDLEKSVVDHG